MDGISRSRGWDKEFPHCVLPMEQLVLSDKWARILGPRDSLLGKGKNWQSFTRTYSRVPAIIKVIKVNKPT